MINRLIITWGQNPGCDMVHILAALFSECRSSLAVPKIIGVLFGAVNWITSLFN